MKKLLLAALGLIGACTFSPKEPRPYIFLRTSAADQACAGPKGYLNVLVYATLLNFPKPLPEVHLEINSGFAKVDLVGETVTWDFAKLGIGRHEVTAEAGGIRATKTFTIYSCLA